MGGDWNFEINLGNVIPSEIFSVEAKKSYSYVLGADDTQIDFWYGQDQQFGNVGIPQTWVNILGNVADPDGIDSLTYSLNGDPKVALSIGSDTRRLGRTGDFNVDIAFADLDASPVDDEIEITATDSFGNVTTETVFVNYESGNTSPQTYSIDWSSVSNIQDVAQVVDGKWGIEGDTIRIIEPDYDRFFTVGDIAWENYEVTVPVTINDLPSFGPRDGYGVGFISGWTGHTDDPISGFQPKTGFLPLGAISWYHNDRLEIFTEGQTVRDNTGKTLEEDVTYTFKVRFENIEGVGGQYSFKVWEQNQIEPVDWDVVSGQGPGNDRTGSVGILAHEYDVSFGDVNVVPIGGGEPPANQAPIANDDVAIVAPGNAVDIDVLSNDSDSDGTLVPDSLNIVAQPNNGNLSFDGNGIVSYTHDGSATTSDSFIYTVDDNDGETSNTATVDLTIEEPAENPAPIANDDSDTVLPEQTVDPTGDAPNIIYRFFNNSAGVHFYTADDNEKNAAQELDNFNFEGASYAGIDPLTGIPEPSPVYRFLNEDTGVHLYTVSEQERDVVEELDNYNFEGDVFFAHENQVDGSIPIFRFFNATTGAHFYTPSTVERDNVENNLPEFESEGIAYYALPIDVEN